MKHWIRCLFMLLSGWASAQAVRQSERREVVVPPNQAITVRYDQPYTSALLYFADGQSLRGTYLIAAGDTLHLRPEPHAPAGQPMSALCVFRQPVAQLSLQTGSLSGAVTLLTLYAPPLPQSVQHQIRASARLKADCAKPDVVPASVWRQGLTPPKEKPVATKVQFVIVHHSAGSNATTNFTEEVRNIYLQHTQINGWNDTGYNFLIGRDGVIYEGRDGQGLMDGDNVLGAHFCSHNSGTMGICLMGNFNDVQPSEASLVSLRQLTGWKLKKEGLQPIGTAFHASSTKQLNLISGHRDGLCATECPGNNLYAALPAIRQEVSRTCSFASPVLATEPAAADWTVYPNPSPGTFFVQHTAVDPGRVHFDLVDGLGRKWPVVTAPAGTGQWRITAEAALPGLYWLRCLDGTTITARPVWRSRE